LPVNHFRFALTILGLALAVGSTGCDKSDDSSSRNSTSSSSRATVESGSTSDSHPQFPARPAMRTLAPGIEFCEMRVRGDGAGLPMTLNLYLPAGQHAAKSLPCVLIAPAGTAFHGSVIDESDRAEHLPYVKEGFAVMAYELSGALANPHARNLTYKDVIPPLKEFMKADGGLVNGKIAIDYIVAKVPEIDPAQLFACGHSSSAVVALNLAAGDNRIRAVCAYAPRTNVEDWWNDPKMDKLVPGFKDFATRKSPLRHASSFNCPVFIFHADDDSMVPLGDNQRFVAVMKGAGKKITFKQVPTGDHYDSMIEQGIPAGIDFMMFQGARPAKPATAATH
jgi:acetyl esterase/lipase